MKKAILILILILSFPSTAAIHSSHSCLKGIVKIGYSQEDIRNVCPKIRVSGGGVKTINKKVLLFNFIEVTQNKEIITFILFDKKVTFIVK